MRIHSQLVILRIRDETIFPSCRLILEDGAICNNISISSFSCLSNPADRMTISAKILTNLSSPPYNDTKLDDIHLPPHTLRIPIEIKFVISRLDKNYKLPKTRVASCKLITLASLPIPIIINYDILFGENKISDRKNYDPFENHIRSRCLLSNIDMELMKNEEYQLILDLKSLACLDYKYERLPNPNLEENSKNEISKVVLSTSWEFTNLRECAFKKTIKIDINALGMKNILGNLHWVPEFQSCVTGKIYLLEINLKIGNSSDITINLSTV